MRVCFLTSEFPPHPGGIARSALRIVESLAGSGIEIHVFTPVQVASQPQTGPPERLRRNVYVYATEYSGDLSRALYASLSEIVGYYDRLLRFDLFHGFEIHMACPAISIAGNRPIIASFRGIDAVWMLEKPHYAKLATAVLNRANWITAVSTKALANARQIVDISTRSSFIPNAINAAEAVPWDPEPGVVGTACTFRPKKQIPMLVRAYARLSPKLRSHLLLVGGSRRSVQRLAVESEIDRQCIRGETTITGIVDRTKVFAFMARMNVFVICSDHEGLPNAILEAAATGLPIVATAIDGIKDLFQDGVDALLVPRGDDAALTKAIEDVLGDRTIGATLGRNAKQLASRCTIEREQEAWRELYLKLGATIL